MLGNGNPGRKAAAILLIVAAVTSACAGDTVDPHTVSNAPTVNSVTSSSLTVSWTAATEATFYNVYRAMSSGGPYVWLTMSTDTSIIDRELSAGTAYFYRVAACTSAGCSSQSVAGTGTTSAPLGGAPAAPGAPEVDSATSTSLNLRWNAVSGATYYRLFRGPVNIGTYVSFLSTNGTSHTDTGLGPATTFFYRVVACNAIDCSSQSPYGSGTTSGSTIVIPAIPSAPTVGSATPTSLTISWSVVSGATYYVVYRSTSSGGSFANIYSTAATSYTEQQLVASTTYYYRVTACNSAGCSGQSSWGSGVTSAR